MIRLRLHCAFVLALASPAFAAGPDAVISRTVEALRRQGPQVVAGATLTSVVVLPEMYERRGFEPLWTNPDAVENLLRSVEASASFGLVPEDFHLASIRGLRGSRSGGEQESAELDLVLTDALVRLVYHHRFGKVDPERLDVNWNHARPLMISSDPAASLQALIDGADIASFLEGIGPQTGFYRRLREALGEYRQLEADGGWPTVPAGPTLEPCATDARVPALRRRLAVTGDLMNTGAPADPCTARPERPSVARPPAASVREDGDVDAALTYDTTVQRGVEAFQKRHGLKPDAVIGPATLRELNVPVAYRIDQIRASLERARWVQHDLPERAVFVNVAGFKVYFYDRGEIVWESRVVVGKPYTKTPIFRADMKFLVLNPTWTIPSSIVRGEVLPGIRRDPDYLAKKGFVKVEGQFVQPAGPKNALGRIKMMFPNPHSVYLHDTPSKSFFNETTRTFSHGCIRVEKPVELAALALNDPAWTVETLESAIATGTTRTVNLRASVPVLVLYWTAVKSRSGIIQFLPDIYSRDAAIIRGLHEAPRPPKRPFMRRAAD